MIKWECKAFAELTNEELYKVLQLRIEVFAVEQNVVYQDCDNKDFKAFHFIATDNDLLIAYCRIIPPGISYSHAASIGRVVTSPLIRGKSIGKQLFKNSLEQLYSLFGHVPIIISAQAYLVKFYENFSFITQGATYIEDNIPHIAMIKDI
ncbi:MAG: GNAT family N-acetyltransferase [Ginsengibacter sp.]